MRAFQSASRVGCLSADLVRNCASSADTCASPAYWICDRLLPRDVSSRLDVALSLTSRPLRQLSAVTESAPLNSRRNFAADAGSGIGWSARPSFFLIQFIGNILS